MNNKADHENYYQHLKGISLKGRIYKRFFSSPLLYVCARFFGKAIVEVGCGTGSGLIGSFPTRVTGLDINSLAVEYCSSTGKNVKLIKEDGGFPLAGERFDTCVLDNVLEHIENPKKTLDECYRITRPNGGLVIVVPGLKGFESDQDHKIFYDINKLRILDNRWMLVCFFAIPSLFLSNKLSVRLKQYCIVAVYRKI